MLEASIDHAEDDFKARLLVDARNEGDMLIRATKKSLKDGQKWLQPSEVTKIGDAIQALKEAMSGENHTLVREKIGDLDKATHHLAEVLMNKTLQTGVQGHTAAEILDK
jgi:molecular chaperone DnaK